MNQMHVCMISYTFPPLYSGAGAQSLQLAKSLVKRGVSVSVLTSRHTSEFPARETVDGVPVHRLPVFRLGRLRPLSFSLVAAWHLLQHYRRYDIVHIHGAYWRMFPMLLIAKLVRKKSVVKMTQMGTDDPQTIRWRRFGRVLYQTLTWADAVVSTSRELSASYQNSSLPPDKLIQIPNGVDTDLFHLAGASQRNALRAKLGLPAEAALVIFVGKVGHRKGADILLQVWTRVVEQHPDAWLVLVGPVGEDFPLPEDEPPIEHWLSKASQTLVLGHQDNVQDYLRAGNIFVLPSRMEGLPNALMEAMATGLPCIASNIGGNIDLIANGENGLLFKCGDTQQLADMLLRLLCNDEERRELGRRARETIKVNYSMDTVAEKYVELYHRLLESQDQ